tara:strand:- start:84 stop:251 length:168 start_codon:yes stop_codon:yes gene_type:complete
VPEYPFIVIGKGPYTLFAASSAVLVEYRLPLYVNSVSPSAFAFAKASEKVSARAL